MVELQKKFHEEQLKYDSLNKYYQISNENKEHLEDKCAEIELEL